MTVYNIPCVVSTDTWVHFIDSNYTLPLNVTARTRAGCLLLMVSSVVDFLTLIGYNMSVRNMRLTINTKKCITKSDSYVNVYILRQKNFMDVI